MHWVIEIVVVVGCSPCMLDHILVLHRVLHPQLWAPVVVVPLFLGPLLRRDRLWMTRHLELHIRWIPGYSLDILGFGLDYMRRLDLEWRPS